MDREFVLEAFRNSSSKNDFALKLGFPYFNGTIGKKLDELAKEFNLDFAELLLKRSLKKRKYERIRKQCPVCPKTFETLKGYEREKQTCSYSCANKMFQSDRLTEESKIKTSESLKKFHFRNGTIRPLQEKVCEGCKSFFTTNKPKQKYCSKGCNGANISEETRNLLREAQKKLVAEGRHKGWRSRAKCNRSWAEDYVEKLFNERGLKRGVHFEVEYHQNKWFIDFAFLEKKIALEIDGAQHKLPERQAKDQERDAWLTANGWTVIRIPWKRVDKKVYEELSSRIDDLIRKLDNYGK